MVKEEKAKDQNSKEDFIKFVIETSAEFKTFLNGIKKGVMQAENYKKSLRNKISEINAEKASELQKQEEEKQRKIKEELELKQQVEEKAKLEKEKQNSKVEPVKDFENKNNIAEKRPVSKNSNANFDKQRTFNKDRENNGQGTRTRRFDPEANLNRNADSRTNANSAGGFKGKNFGKFNSNSDNKNFNEYNKSSANSSNNDFSMVSNKPDTKGNSKKKHNEHNSEEKKSMNRKALLMRGFVEDETLANEDGESFGSKKNRNKKNKVAQTIIAPKIEHCVITTENLTVKMLAEKTGHPVTEIIKKFMLLGMMVNINSNIDFDSAELIAGELGVTLEKKIEKTYEEKLFDKNAVVDDEKDLVKRPPVVTVLGHVDHGKTSLLDYIRETNVIAGEAGGITQHIGAYTIEKNKEMITFIDTPGHAAFASMRARGVKLTDIAILVVAADDGVMPQTIEAIKYIKEVKVPLIVAVNKIDKTNGNYDRIKQQLSENDVVPEEWGGDAIIIPISAKTGFNIDKLLEMILFVADYQNLKANPKRAAMGSVIEARLDKGMGTVASVLVQNGTLKVGDFIIAGTSVGKVRALINEKGKNVKSAGPSFAVSVLGLSSVPSAGDEVYAVDEKTSKKVLSERVEREKTGKIKEADISVDSLMNRFKEVEYKAYNVIIKADVRGSLEALQQSLSVIENEEVKVKCIHGGVGAINENDIMLASASNALIIGFNVKPDFKAKVLSEKYKINIKYSKIIYEVIDHVTTEINKLLTPKYKDVVSGHAEVRVIFKASKVGAIAGSYILDGKLTKNMQVRVLRKNKEVFNGQIATIQREKNEVKEILGGFECGIVLKDFSSYEVGDIIEGYIQERIN